MSDYRVDDHRVDRGDVVGSWLLAAVLVAVLFGLIVPLGL